MTITLRADQAALVERVRNAYRMGARAVCMQSPTGFGKTTTAAEIIRKALALGRRIVFAAHLDALIDDTSDRLTSGGIDHGIVQADRPTNPIARVQLASLATLHRRGERPPADLFIVDECHRAAAESVRGILDSYPEARILGLTATPERGDGAPLGDVFDQLVCGPSVRDLTRAGLLAPAIVLSPAAPLEGGLAMDPLEAWQRWAQGRRAIVFARDVEHAQAITSSFVSAGAAAECIIGTTARAVRDGLRDRISSGETRVLVGVNVFLEGFDAPPIEVAILARGFTFAGTFIQATGRVLRPSPSTGKTHATILDLSGASILHGLPADDRVYSLEGDAVRRTGEALAPLARCGQCLAIFHLGPPACPRCGATLTGKRLPRRATRIERQELARLDTRPQHERDAMAIRGIERKLLASGRFPAWKVPEIARGIVARSNRKKAASA